MELMQQEVKGYSDSREEEEEEEEAAEIIIPRERAESSSSSSRLYQQADAASNFINSHRKQLDFMDLSLGNNKDDVVEANFQELGSSSTTTLTPTPTHHAHGNNEPVEKEHMFDKVVTPSDVGKLNRLVIPKQHAEKYFPLDSSANEKGLLLNFEDRNGKPWRFRYSYWNSSQSYVMTKGWSRFVKEKKLDAGDVVSFQRGLGDSFRHRLYIDWRRRPDHAPNHSSATMITPLFLPNQPHLSHYSVRWGGRLYSLPSSPPTSRHHHHDHLQQQQQQQLNHNMYTFPQHQQQQHREYHQQFFHGGGLSHHHNNYNELMMNSGSGSLYYLRSTPSMSMGDQNNNLTGQQQDRGNIIAPMIIDSVPVAHHHHHHHLHHDDKSSSGASSGGTSGSASPSAAGKRLRLFGVNMECASSSPAEEPKCCSLLSSTTSVAHVTMANSSLPSSSLQPLQRLRVPHEGPLSSSARLGDQRGGTSMLFDLDPSLQYRQ